jgi:protein-disulfide isomerase
MARFTLALILLLHSAAALGQQPADCGCEAGRPEFLAVVNGEKIAAKDVEADTARAAAVFRVDLDRTRARMLQAVITDRLLDLEAARRGLSRGDLVRTEAMGKAAPPTEREVREVYERDYGDEHGTFERRRAEIETYLVEKRREQAYFAFTQALRSAARVEVLDASPKAPATEADRARVLATVDGALVTLGEVEDRALPVTYELRRKIYEIEKRALDERIADALIAQEAARRGMTPQDLLDTDVGAKVHIVDADEAAAYYASHQGEFGGRPFADVRDRLVGALQQRVDDRAVDAYVATLRAAAKVEVHLVEPAPPDFAVDAAERPARGNPKASVTVVEFSDFQCPRCAAATASVQALLATYGDRVRLVAREFPLPQHVMAFSAAEAAEAAFEQGKYWEYAALLFANQDALTEAKLKALATEAGLDRTRFDADLASHRFKARVERDVVDGNRLGIFATPAFFVDGRPVSDPSEAALKAAIDDALSQHGAR